MLKIGGMTAVLLDRLGIDETFRLLGECGFDFIDFSCNALDHSLMNLVEKPDPLAGVYDLPFERIGPLLAPYKEAASRHGLTFGQAHAPYPLYWPGNDARNEYLRQALQKCVALCGYLDCPYLVVHPAFLGDPKDEWRVNMAMYKALVPALKEHNVVCCLENLFVTRNGKPYEAVCADPYEACDYIDELNDYAGEKRFAFCFDTGHALLTGRDVYSTIMKLGGRIETLHIHDNDGKRDLHLAPYMGVLDWERFILGLRDVGYTGGLSFETHNTLHIFDSELTGEVMRLIAATGRLFARKIENAGQ
ncbi:MAG: sugar phosphate isomerase/epimerase [Clostridia bacterium]|nr:sugar phosphate isomerase/epimerase [Clostridia bacterium]